jgi:hypothetical protein
VKKNLNHDPAKKQRQAKRVGEGMLSMVIGLAVFVVFCIAALLWLA